ncbi:MAG: hypothetical protein D6768_04985 [Chloroflexi bacterium]|nr:MAG: hypothetical protein D6768_04985 [Chloroflexota bacterium]
MFMRKHTAVYEITIRRAGTVLDVVTVEARDVQEAIEQLDAAHEKFTVLISDGPDELITAQWSGYEYEARLLKPS